MGSQLRRRKRARRGEEERSIPIGCSGVISPSIKFKDHSYGREIIGRKKHPGPSRERESASVESRGLNNSPTPPPQKQKKKIHLISGQRENRQSIIMSKLKIEPWLRFQR